MNEDDMSPLEQERRKRAKLIPKPNVPVTCRHCGSEKKEALQNQNAKADFYWRYYKCKACGKNYWCGVRHADGLTVFTTNTPKLTRVNSTQEMTGNLRNILPPGHIAITAEYDQFLPNGKLPRNVLMAKLDAEESEARAANPDPIEPPNVATTTQSNAEDIATIYYDEFMPLIIEKNLTHLAADQIRQLFTRWLAVTYPNMKE